MVREASAFFIEQILLGPDADSYRVLGADRNAAAAELRRNMALLLRWLHPDMTPRPFDVRRTRDGGVGDAQDTGAARRLR